MLSRLVRVPCLSCLLLLSPAVGSSAGQAESPGCPVRIVVLDSTTQPLPGAQVTLFPLEHRFVAAGDGAAGAARGWR